MWLGLWNSSTPAEPESRDEQKIKDFMVQKYERKRWYIPPQQVASTNTSQSISEPKPLKQLLGENTPTATLQVSTKNWGVRHVPLKGAVYSENVKGTAIGGKNIGCTICLWLVVYFVFLATFSCPLCLQRTCAPQGICLWIQFLLFKAL